jgi:hypothetical protein
VGLDEGVWEECGYHTPKCDVSGRERAYLIRRGPQSIIK